LAASAEKRTARRRKQESSFIMIVLFVCVGDLVAFRCGRFAGNYETEKDKKYVVSEVLAVGRFGFGELKWSPVVLEGHRAQDSLVSLFWTTLKLIRSYSSHPAVGVL
jgi:hypothetical protein